MKLNFSALSENLARCHGGAIAVVNVERGRIYTFRDYHLVTNRIANAIRHVLGLSKGERYACILKNDNLSLLHFYTAMKSDAICCYANYRDPLSTHMSQLALTGVRLAFIEAELLDTHYAPLRAAGITVVSLEPPGAQYEDALDFWSLVECASEENPNIDIDDRDDPIVMRFTGGTTGDSKCALYTADLLLKSSETVTELPEVHMSGARTIHLAPISHASGLMFLPTILNGGCNITLNDADFALWCRSIAAHDVTHGFIVPTLAYRMLELSDDHARALGSLKTIIYGASPMSPEKLRRLIARFGPIFMQIYGSTEHFSASTILTKAEHLGADDAPGRLASAGRPIPTVELAILDDDGAPLGPGSIGEICLRSRAVCSGYFANPAATAAEFVDGFWKSGDLGYRDAEGYLYVVDRKKDMIITGGFNVYATDVENALNAHPSVALSAVVGVPHEHWGEAVHAEVVLLPHGALTEADLRAFVINRLGSYKAPKTISFVDSLPLSVAGKLLRKDVRAKYWEDRERLIG